MRKKLHKPDDFHSLMKQYLLSGSIMENKDLDNVIKSIARENGIQYTSYLVKEKRFVNLSRLSKNEYSTISHDAIYSLVHPYDYSVVKSMMERLDNGENSKMKYEYRLKFSFSNEYSWRHISIHPLELDDDGKVLIYLVMGIADDKSHEMMKDIALFNKKLLFISSINSVLYVQYNRMTREFFRLDDSADKKSHSIPLDIWKASFHPDDLHLAQELLDFMDKGEGERAYSEYRYKYPDQYVWFSVNVAAYEHDEEGRIVTYLCLCTNVDKKHRELEREKQLRRKADAANELKNRFIQNLSHEIRTPLNAIVGFSNEMSKDLSDEQAESFKEIIQRNNRQLLSIIDYTLNKSLFESGFAQIALVPVSLKSFLEET